jgi:hypothetical protein
MSAPLTFFAVERFATLVVNAIDDVKTGDAVMNLVGTLSIVTAYLALAFVGAIVCGAFNGVGF